MTLKDGNRAAIKLQGNQGHTDFIKVVKSHPKQSSLQHHTLKCRKTRYCPYEA